MERFRWGEYVVITSNNGTLIEVRYVGMYHSLTMERFYIFQGGGQTYVKQASAFERETKPTITLAQEQYLGRS